jgi:hypothetical protein
VPNGAGRDPSGTQPGQVRPSPERAPARGTPGAVPAGTTERSEALHPDRDPFALGVLVGVLIGEGHFGGDGKQPHVTLRMHARHRSLFEWLLERWPAARLYGPYAHGGRNYYQLMFRGNALKYRLIPLLDSLPWSEIDERTYARYRAMKERYGLDETT